MLQSKNRSVLYFNHILDLVRMAVDNIFYPFCCLYPLTMYTAFMAQEDKKEYLERRMWAPRQLSN